MSASVPVDLTMLREITDGNAALEAELFRLFVDTTRRCLEKLHQYLPAEGSEWSEAAHELKGAAASMGALPLATLCAEAEKQHGIDARTAILSCLVPSAEEALNCLRQVTGDIS